MRLYFAFISVTAGWLGITYCGVKPDISRQIAVLIILFLGWGVNQVINDYLCLPEDKHNAPHRATVTKELDTKFALYASIGLGFIGLMVSFYLNAQSIVIYLLFFILNITYKRAKRMPLLGNIIFGLLIVPCIYYAAMIAGNRGLADVLQDSKLAILAMLVWLANFTLCFFADFKDYAGDKLENVKTLVVVLGINKARYLGFFLIALPFLCLYFFLKWSLLLPYPPGIYFLAVLSAAFLSFFWAAVLFYKFPQGKSTYYSLKWVITGAVLFETALIGIADTNLSIILFIANFFLVRIIFARHRDYLA